MSLLKIAEKYGLRPDLESMPTKYSGVIDGEEKYNDFIDDIKVIGMSFATSTSRLGKDDSIVFKLKAREKGSEEMSTLLPYDGMPFQIVKTTYFTCAQGGLYRQQSTDDQSCKKKRFWVRPTKKINCPATMVVRCLRVFNEECYKCKAPTYQNGSWELRIISKKLRADLQSSSPPTGVLRFNVIMSSEEEHSHTAVSSKLSSIIHPRLRDEIHSFVTNNMCSTKTMKIHLEEVVQRMFEDKEGPKPDRQNRCYYPTDQSIRFQMHKALYKIKEGKYDQDALGPCVTTWQTEFPDDNFSYRPYGVENTSQLDEEPTCSTLLFCHQSKWQQDLLERYGNRISVLDTTYKTTKYDIPLYFIFVKTNSGYCVVGTFVVQSESNVLIAEALSQFKEWNPDWDPKYFLTDNSEAGINALEETFPESTVYLSTFHREQSWHRWLMKTGNVPRKAIAPFMRLWQDIAASYTDEEYVHNVNKLFDNKFYQESAHAQQYFSDEWLAFNYLWVSACHDKDFLSMVNTNNGIEAQKRILNHTYLKTTKYSTLTGLIKTVIKFYLPEMLHDYCISNAMVNCELNETLPEFLSNRPRSFIDHVMDRLESAKEFDSSHVNVMGEGLFIVKSEINSDDWFHVDLQEASCRCLDFSKWRFPCVHMCVVFMHTEWGFDSLPQSYREDPFITVDTNYTAVIGVGSDVVVQTSTLTDESSDNWHFASTIDHDDYSKPYPEDLTANTLSPLPTDYTSIDENKCRLELQRNLTTLMGYATLQFTPESLEEFVELSHQWTKTARSLVTKSKEGLLLSPREENASGSSLQLQTVKNIKKKYMSLPKRTKTKLNDRVAGSMQQKVKVEDNVVKVCFISI